MTKVHVSAKAPLQRNPSGCEIFQKKLIREICILISLTLGVLISGSMTSAQVFLSGPESDASARPDKEIVAEQYLLMGSATRGTFRMSKDRGRDWGMFYAE